MNKHRRFWALWGWPIVMGVLSTTGLLTALVSDTCHYTRMDGSCILAVCDDKIISGSDRRS